MVFNLKEVWFELMKQGIKAIEYRECKDYWSVRLKNLFVNALSGYDNMQERIKYVNFFNAVMKNDFEAARAIKFEKEINIPITFRLGYSKGNDINCFIQGIFIADGKRSDLRIDKPVFAIQIGGIIRK